MLFGGLVDVSSIIKIRFHMMKKSEQNTVSSMIDAF